MNNFNMEFTIENINQTVKAISNGTGISLMIGNEYDNTNSKPNIWLEDISGLQDKRLMNKLSEIQRLLIQATTELRDVAVECFYNEPMLEGSLETDEDSIQRDTQIQYQEISQNMAQALTISGVENIA